MTEEQAVYDAVPDAVRVEDVVLTLAGQVDDLRRRVENIDHRINDVECGALFDHNSALERISDVDRRLDKLQDANLAPVLESSAVLVELRRIADAVDRMDLALEYLKCTTVWLGEDDRAIRVRTAS